LALMSGSGWAIVLGIWLIATGMNYRRWRSAPSRCPDRGAGGRARRRRSAARAAASRCAPTLDPYSASRSDRRARAGLEPPAPAPRASRRFTGGASSEQVAAELDSDPRNPQEPSEGQCEVRAGTHPCGLVPASDVISNWLANSTVEGWAPLRFSVRESLP
jgi:hypothetical protein